MTSDQHVATVVSWVGIDGNRWCSCGHAIHVEACPVRHCPCLDVNQLMFAGDLATAAMGIVDRLRAAGFPAEGAVNRNVLCLAEEVGEFVGAYRRWSGQARRPGSAADMYAELADVVITAYVTACELGMDLNAAIAAKLEVIFTRGWREPAADQAVNTVPCGFECGYLGDSETDLDAHEAGCDQAEPVAVAEVPAPRLARSLRRGGGGR